MNDGDVFFEPAFAECFVAKITDYKLFPLIVIVFSMLDQLVIGSEMLPASKKRLEWAKIQGYFLIGSEK